MAMRQIDLKKYLPFAELFDFADIRFYLFAVSGFGIIALFYFLKIIAQFSVSTYRCDFLNMWTGARLALEGQVMTLFNLQSYHHAQDVMLGWHFHWPQGPINRNWDRQLNWSYPPHFLQMIAPLGLVGYPAAYGLWLAVTFALFCVAVAGWQPRPLCLCALLLIAPITVVNVALGQNGFLIGALLVGGLRLMEKRPTYAGILFGILTIKPHLGLLLPIILLVRRSWRAIIVAGLTAAALIALSIALWGIEPWVIYFTKTTIIQKNILQSPLPKFYMASLFNALRSFTAPVWLAYALQGLVALMVACYCAYAAGAEVISPNKKIVLFLTGTALLSPYMFTYDLPIIAAAILYYLIDRSSPWVARVEDLWLVAIWGLPIFTLLLLPPWVSILPLFLMMFFALQLLDIEKTRIISISRRFSGFDLKKIFS